MLRLVRAVKQAGRGFARNVFCLKMRSIAGNGKEYSQENSKEVTTWLFDFVMENGKIKVVKTNPEIPRLKKRRPRYF